MGKTSEAQEWAKTAFGIEWEQYSAVFSAKKWEFER